MWILAFDICRGPKGCTIADGLVAFAVAFGVVGAIWAFFWGITRD